MNRELIKSIILETQSSILRVTGIERSDYESFLLGAAASKPIKIISGLRRSGKSFLLKRIVKELATKTPIDNVLYLNFEDYRLQEYNTAADLDQILEIFVTSVAKSGVKILVFDEIQLVRDWNKFIRSIYERDIDNQYEIFITGSNSDLLSAEFAENLAGRHIDLHIQSFSFAEFLRYHEICPLTESQLIRDRELITKRFVEYYSYGGLAETFGLLDTQAKQSYLEGIMSKVLLDDVTVRFKVRNTLAIAKLLKFVLANSGEVVSFTKIRNYLRALGINIDVETVVMYAEHLAKAFAFYEVQKFNWKTNKIFDTSKKFYASDLGLANLYRDLSTNLSRLLENLVYLKLRRDCRFQNIYYGRDDNEKEIDFITVDNRNKIVMYQVTTELNEDNYQRELQPLIQETTATKYLLVLKGEDLLLENDIRQVNIVSWLLGLTV